MGLQRVGHNWSTNTNKMNIWYGVYNLVLWPPHTKSWLIGKDCDAGRDWGQEEKGTTEDEMAGWHHGLNACESEWTLGVGDGQGGLACCSSWDCKELDTTEWLNWTELKLGERGEWKSWLKAQHSENEDHSIRSHHFMRNRWGNSGNCVRLFWGAPKSLQMVIAAMKLKVACSLKEKWWPT